MHIVFLLIVLPFLCWQQPQTQLTVTVENIRCPKGILKICVFDNEADFMAKAVTCAEVTGFSKPEHTHTFTLKTGNQIAVVVYHDKNANGKLDRNFLGIPNEPYGFSNNPSTLFGTPTFERATIDPSQTQSIHIRL